MELASCMLQLDPHISPDRYLEGLTNELYGMRNLREGRMVLDTDTKWREDFLIAKANTIDRSAKSFYTKRNF